MEQDPTKSAQEQIPETFPIVEDTSEYIWGFPGGEPEARENEIIHFFQEDTAEEEGGEKFENYLLQRTIGRYHYLFFVRKSRREGYRLFWETKEYLYARTDLTKEETAVLFKTIQSFLNSVSSKLQNTGEFITAKSHSANYSTKEIDQCKDEILGSPENELNHAELTAKYKGAEIFRLYKELFGKPFFENEKSLYREEEKRARERYYRTMFKKYLTGWETEQNPSGDFVFKPKDVVQKLDNTAPKNV